MNKNDTISALTLPIAGVTAPKERVCVQFLEECGYKILPPLSPRTVAKNIPGLIGLFNGKAQSMFPGRSIQPSDYKISERRIMSIFLRSLKKTASSSKRAYSEASLIIETLFEHHEFFGLPTIDTMAILLDRRLVGAVIQFINDENDGRQAIFEAEVDRVLDLSVDLPQTQDSIRAALSKLHEKVCHNVKKDG